MSDSVRISRKAARALLAEMTGSQLLSRAAQELEAALKPKRAVGLRRQRKKTKRATKREETAAIRDAAIKRGEWCCEACGNMFGVNLRPAQLDHFFGRGKAAQSIQNCWALCPNCHRAKTDNKPSAEFWLERFAVHARKHGYMAEVLRCQARLDSLRLMKEAEAASR